jgi:hypothetical protein
MRDRLPDLLHERLDASDRAAIMMHVAQCADCRGELTILREAHVALTSDMRAVDVAAIARVVVTRVSASAVHSLSGRRRARRWMDWRIAASIAVVAIGSASFALIRSRQHTLPVPSAPVVAEATPESVSAPKNAVSSERLPSHTAPAPAATTAELSAAGGVSDLSDRDLRALLDDLQSIDAEPPTEPEPVSVRVTLPGSRGGTD